MTTQKLKQHWGQPEKLPSPSTCPKQKHSQDHYQHSYLLYYNWLNGSMSALNLPWQCFFVKNTLKNKSEADFVELQTVSLCKSPVIPLKDWTKNNCHNGPCLFLLRLTMCSFKQTNGKTLDVSVVSKTLQLYKQTIFRQRRPTKHWRMTLQMHMLPAMVDLLHILWSGVTQHKEVVVKQL